MVHHELALISSYRDNQPHAINPKKVNTMNVKTNVKAGDSDKMKVYIIPIIG